MLNAGTPQNMPSVRTGLGRRGVLPSLYSHCLRAAYRVDGSSVAVVNVHGYGGDKRGLLVDVSQP